MIAKFKKNKKSSWHSVFLSIFLSFSLLAIIGFLVITNLKMSQKRAGLNTRIESLKGEIQTLDEKNRELKAQISQGSSPVYLEEKLRAEGYQKEGEETVVIKMKEDPEAKETEKENFLQQIWEKLKFW